VAQKTGVMLEQNGREEGELKKNGVGGVAHNRRSPISVSEVLLRGNHSRRGERVNDG